MTTSDSVLVARKIYPWLPSFRGVFTIAEPLTRIRDIAHRNDIPKELKKNIKEKLQNKLHRCAGPEDLATSEAFLGKITAPGADYSSPFVEAFKTFHEQLKEFFNARSLEEQLEAIAGKGKTSSSKAGKTKGSTEQKSSFAAVKLVNEFLEAKRTATSSKDLTTTLEHLTALRSESHQVLSGDINAQGQELQTADIALEDFSFVLLSQLVNHFEVAAEKIQWLRAIHVLEQTIKNLRLSHLNARECQAIESELTLWREGFEPEKRDHLLRVKATLDRCQRLAAFYCDKILSLFLKKAETLGRALGVPPGAIKVFCEADIRSHLVFQFSRAVDLLLKSIRIRAALPLWDAIVPGQVFGRLVEAPNMDNLSGPHDEPVVVLLEKVEGDEEIPTAVAGIILAHETPHLSHLAVRARQRAIPFVASEDRDHFSELKCFVEKPVSLYVSGEEVDVECLSQQQEGSNTKNGEHLQPHHVKIPHVILSSDPSLLALDQVQLSTGGGKAHGAKRLKDLSMREGAGFEAVHGLVVPFGVMEAALHAAPSQEQAYLSEIAGLNELEDPSFSKVLAKLRRIVRTLDVSSEIVSKVKKQFSLNGPLMVRSSANCEDLEGFSGAGLYNSVANVSPSDVAQGIREVWSSLWSKRAVVSRKRLGIPHKDSHMAVLIQPMLAPQFSFIMHTANPMKDNDEELYVELAVGLGETLASATTPGTPYRMVCNKQTKKVQTMAFASFSQAVMPGPSGDLIRQPVDYSRIPLSTDEGLRNDLGSRLAAIGRFVEDATGGPQDVEGVVVGEEVYLVQMRPQQ
jgi:phosphoglucan,water dikinase